jgi:hypothetical protein
MLWGSLATPGALDFVGKLNRDMFAMYCMECGGDCIADGSVFGLRDREISPSIAEVMVDIIERSYVSKGKVIGSGTIDVMELLKRLVGSQDWCVRAQ